eukprot:3401630-Lingulodinium_polyedra.AAC.1
MGLRRHSDACRAAGFTTRFRYAHDPKSARGRPITTMNGSCALAYCQRNWAPAGRHRSNPRRR